jgi:hypothetical protein
MYWSRENWGIFGFAEKEMANHLMQVHCGNSCATDRGEGYTYPLM